MGSQKLTRRQQRTPAVAAPPGTPNPVSVEMLMNSTTPRPPGVIGMTAKMLASPYATSRSIGETWAPKAKRKTHSELASRSQLAAAQMLAR